MPLVRMLVSWAPPSLKPEDVFTNTLYFNVSGAVGQDPDYQDLVNDLRDIYAGMLFTSGCKLEVRAYDMADAKPRPEKAYATVTRTGGPVASARQVAVCLSYYADRNLPRTRGRIYTGPWANGDTYVKSTITGSLIAMGLAFAGIGGLNVDWSVYSPTNNDATRITNIWVDNSWDVVRSRKIDGTTRATATING